jgi:UDP-N-acetylmuramoyl-L-alanyl-D-glutamate--2,6-diaminopimelate ligase
MGEVSSRLADVTIITNDNPRTERAEAIASDIRAGFRGSPQVILDRATAIARAIGDAQPGDLVLIAGKGHENYQIFGTTKVHFDDREAAISALQQRRETTT